MIANAIHYSMKLDQSFKALIKSSCLEIKNLVIICKQFKYIFNFTDMHIFYIVFLGIQWLLLAYGIIALGHHYALLCLVPFPSIFYILTVRFTDPAEFREVESRNN